MKKLVYAMLVALVGSPPAIAQSDDRTEEQAAVDAEKPDADDAEPAMLTEEEAAENDAAKADMGSDNEDAQPDE